MRRLKMIPMVGRDFAFRATVDVNASDERRCIDFRNALRFLDVLSRQGRLMTTHEVNEVVHQISAHLSRCGSYRPLSMFPQYSLALAKAVELVRCSSKRSLSVGEAVHCLLWALYKAKREDVSLYGRGALTCFSLFVQREFQREITVGALTIKRRGLAAAYGT